MSTHFQERAVLVRQHNLYTYNLAIQFQAKPQQPKIKNTKKYKKLHLEEIINLVIIWFSCSPGI